MHLRGDAMKAMKGKMNGGAVLLLSLMLSACSSTYAVPSQGISQDIATAHFNGGASTLRQTLDFRDNDIRR